MSAIEKQLQEVTEIKQKSKEGRQKYLKRLVDACDNDEVWEKLSEETQAWVNAGIKADENDKEISDFPDTEKPAKGKDEGDDKDDDKKKDEDVTKPKNGKAGGKKVAPKEDKAKVEPKAKAAKEPKAPKEVSSDGRIESVWEMLLDKPGASVEEVVKKTKMKDSTVSLAISRYHRMMTFLRANKQLKNNAAA